MEVTSDKMKVANYNKLSIPLCANPFLQPAPPPRQVEDRDNNPSTTIKGKGNISFLMPIAAAEKASRASKQPYQHLRKIQRRSRKLQSRKMARKIKQAMASGAIATRAPRKTMMKTTVPPEEWTPPTSEPISKAFKVAEEQMNQEIMRESWQVDATFEPEDDDDDGLAEEEAKLESISRMSDVMERATKEGILNGSIPSAAYDTEATSSCGKYGDPFIPT